VIYPQVIVDKVYKCLLLDVDNLSISCWRHVEGTHMMKWSLVFPKGGIPYGFVFIKRLPLFKQRFTL